MGSLATIAIVVQTGRDVNYGDSRSDPARGKVVCWLMVHGPRSMVDGPATMRPPDLLTSRPSDLLTSRPSDLPTSGPTFPSCHSAPSPSSPRYRSPLPSPTPSRRAPSPASP